MLKSLLLSFIVVLLCTVSSEKCDLIGIIGPTTQVASAISEFIIYVNYNSDNHLTSSDIDHSTMMTISLAHPMDCKTLQIKAEQLETKYMDTEIRVGVSAYLKENRTNL